MKFLSKTLLISGAYDCTLKVTKFVHFFPIRFDSISRLDLEYQHEYVSSDTCLAQRSRLVIGVFVGLLSFGFARSNRKREEKVVTFEQNLHVRLGSSLAFAQMRIIGNINGSHVECLWC